MRTCVIRGHHLPSAAISLADWAWYSSLPAKNVRQITILKTAQVSKTSAQLIPKEKTCSIIDACLNSRDCAFISSLYEGALKVREIGTPLPEQLKVNGCGLVFNVNMKTGYSGYNLPQGSTAAIL